MSVTEATISIVVWIGHFSVIWLWVLLLAATCFFLSMYPDYIAPLFDKYTPIPDGSLKTKIEELAKELNFPLAKISTVEGKVLTQNLI